MPRPLVFTENLSREDWLQWRKKGIGGSDIAAIVGHSHWDSPLSIYMSKVHDSPPEEESEAMYWGTTLEATVADEFSRRTSFTVKPLNFMIQDDEYSFMLANVDRTVDHPELGRGLLECKTASAFKAGEWEGGKIPYAYFLQIQWYLSITKYPYAYCAALIGGNTFRYTFVERDEEHISFLRAAAVEFWNEFIIPKRMPEVTALDRFSLNVLYPEHREEPYLLSDKEYILLSDLLHRRKVLKEAEEAENLAKNRIMSLMGPCDSIYYGGEKLVTWRKNAKGSRVFRIVTEG